MAEYTMNILTPSVNNLTARIFMRAAGLDFEEVDVWGKTTTPEYMAKYPAHLTPMIEHPDLPRAAPFCAHGVGSVWDGPVACLENKQHQPHLGCICVSALCSSGWRLRC